MKRSDLFQPDIMILATVVVGALVYGLWVVAYKLFEG